MTDLQIIVVVVAWVISAILFFCFEWRNEAVNKERQRVITVLYQRELQEVKSREGYTGQYAEYNSVSYGEMLYKFWKPVGSYFKHIQ